MSCPCGSRGLHTTSISAQRAQQLPASTTAGVDAVKTDFSPTQPNGTRRGLSNPYRRQIPPFIYGSVREKLRSIADLAALGSPATAWLSGLTPFRNSGLRSGDVGTEHENLRSRPSKNRNFPQVF
jgi:hypothetical protein